MRSPFPGMDPYLEHPALWPDVHNSLIAALRDDLAAKLAPKYFVGIEEQLYAVDMGEAERIGRSDLSISPTGWSDGGAFAKETGLGLLEVELPVESGETRETHLEIRKVADRTVVAVIEILSPTNKSDIKGRGAFEVKRAKILESDAHYVEIDLLRQGRPMPLARGVPASPYRILISRSQMRPKAYLIPFGLREPIPSFVLPLLPGDDEPKVELNAILHALFDRARYDLLLDRSQPPVPPLSAEDAKWAEGLRKQPF